MHICACMCICVMCIYVYIHMCMHMYVCACVHCVNMYMGVYVCVRCVCVPECICIDTCIARQIDKYPFPSREEKGDCNCVWPALLTCDETIWVQPLVLHQRIRWVLTLLISDLGCVGTGLVWLQSRSQAASADSVDPDKGQTVPSVPSLASLSPAYHLWSWSDTYPDAFVLRGEHKEFPWL